MAPLKPLAAAFFLLGLVACGEATAGTTSTAPSSSALAIGGGDSSATAAPTAMPTAVPTAAPTAVPTTPAPPPPPTAAPTNAPAAANTCGAPPNPWGYGFCSGATISTPPSDFCGTFNCINNFWNGRGYVMECKDATYSKSGGISGSCSYHGGNWRALLQP